MTDEEWEKLRPFAEASRTATRAYHTFVADRPTELKAQIEYDLACERLRLDSVIAEQNYNRAVADLGLMS
jgi:hypothetical protein